MPAKDHVNDDQFVNFFHSSYNVRPPHEVDPDAEEGRGHYIFGGTGKAARERALASDRTVIHHYKVPRSMVRPEIWADDDFSPEEDPMRRVHAFADNPGPTLFETQPVQPSSVKRGEVLRYRNHMEDAGSISYVMHKKDAQQGGPIRYMGKFDV